MPLFAVLYGALLCTVNGFCPALFRMTLPSCSADLIKDLCQTAINQNKAQNLDD